MHQRSIADHYDAFVADTPLCRLDQRLLADWLPGAPDASEQVVLDLGAGTGRASLALAQRGYRVIAIDLSQPMLERLLQRVHGVDRRLAVLPLRANLVELDALANDSADHAICLFSTLGMIRGRQHRLAMLQHAARIVRPGGKLIVHVHNRWAALREPRGTARLIQSRLASWLHRECEFGDAVYSYRGLQKMFLHRFSRRELCRALQQGGWTIRALQRVSIDGSDIQSSRAIPGGFIVLAQRPPSI